MKRSKDRGLFYSRDSGGKAEMTPAQYVEWAGRRAKEFGVSFDGTPERIEAMIRDGRSADGDLFLDYDVKGNILSRDGLDALIKEAINDPQVTHVFIPRRDRLARPDDPLDGIKLENGLRFAWKTVVLMDHILPPLKKGRKADIAELITALVDYDRAEKDRRDLAQKILHAQIRLARLGYATGGRPPYGFRRWLVREDGTIIRELAEGERVRMAGHHVIWLPTANVELAVVRRILEMLETMPASRVAALLTAEGIPSPDAGRYRRDGGTKHLVSGLWHATTVVNVARNELVVAVATYGLRSMGDKFRYTPEGPRELEESDFRPDEKPKVIRNPESKRIKAPARFPPLVDVERYRRLIADLNARGGTQRGKPRSHDSAGNPLGARIFDMNCSWPMYRSPYGNAFRYTCGLYGQSHGARCAHNCVDGPTATRFVLSCHRQRLLSPTALARFERRLRERAASEAADQNADQNAARLRVELAHVRADLKTVSGNMPLAKTPQQYAVISTKFDELTARETDLQAQIAESESGSPQGGDAEAEVAAALKILCRLADLVADPNYFDFAAQIFQLTNARLFLRFRPVRVKRRILNRTTGGVVTFGAAPPPIEIYRGPTGRYAMKRNGSAALIATEPSEFRSTTPPEITTGSGLEGKSLGNVSRGDWI